MMLIMELEKEKKLNLTYMKQLMEDIKGFLMKKILQHSLQIGKNYICTKKRIKQIFENIILNLAIAIYKKYDIL